MVFLVRYPRLKPGTLIVSFLLGVTLLLALAGPGATANPSGSKNNADSQPSEVIRSYKERTLEILKESQRGNLTEKELAGLRQELVQTLSPIVNFRLMTRSALGPHSRSVSDQQLEELVSVFKPLVVRIYTDRLFSYLMSSNKSWSLQDIEVVGQEIVSGGRYAQIQTLAHVSQGGQTKKLTLNFKMIRQDQDWQVYDIVFEGISLVENYRSQFREVLANHSFDYLVDQLCQKLKNAESNNPLTSNSNRQAQASS